MTEEEKNEAQQELIDIRKNEILGILIIALSILSALSLFTTTGGILGDKLSEIYHLLLGKGSYLLPLLFFLWGLTLIRLKGLQINARLMGFFLSYLSIMAIIHTYLFPVDALLRSLEGKGGGLLGGFLAWLFIKLFGPSGTYVILLAFTLIGILLWFNIFLISLLKHIKDFIRNLFSQHRLKEEEEDFIEEVKKENETNNYLPVEIMAPDLAAGEESEAKTEDVEETEKQQEVSSLPKNTGEESSFEYRLPSVNLLKSSQRNRQKPVNKSELLEETLQSFGVKARVIKVSHGPTITRYEVQPASGVKVSRIVGLADDIALSLAAPGVRIEAPIPGKSAVGVEVPHQQNIVVRLKDILASAEFIKQKSKLSLALGVGIDGQPVVKDLAEMPHLLVAGATGSGKSVCINTIITSILYKALPNEVKLILIDPKKVELSTYSGLPHLFAPVVTDPKKAANVLKLVVEEMEKRYDLFSASGTRGIASYNKSVPIEERLPYIVVIIDELSDLMMVSANEVEDNICRLAQMARAAGIHLVIATQRPSVDVITGLIKANIPSRISFAVSSQTDSRTILDMGGAEKLLGRGDMLLAPAGSQKPQRVQGAFIDNDEINMIVDFVKNQGKPEYEVDLNKIQEVELKINTERDELYEEAVRLVVQYQASISLLQRRLHIGHSRAARLIDLMEEDGIVGPYAGSKPREILISKEELEEYLHGNPQKTNNLEKDK